MVSTEESNSKHQPDGKAHFDYAVQHRFDHFNDHQAVFLAIIRLEHLSYLYPPMQDQIKEAAEIIQSGGLVALPTETVYGLGANGLDAKAVAKVFEAKERPSFNPLILHVASVEQIKPLVKGWDSRIEELAEVFWPGPLTIILPKSDLVPDIVSGGLSTVGIRMPKHPLALQLIESAGVPIAAPSANKFGKISPTKAEHVRKDLGDAIYILNGGETTVGIESTIIKLTTKGFQVLRNGAITKEEIEQIIPFDKSEISTGIEAPGMLKSHYSPSKPFYLISNQDDIKISKSEAGLLSYSRHYDQGFKKVIQMSPDTELKTYAVNLFAAMHEMQESDVDVIYAEVVPEEGIGLAIMDRLKKAAFQYE